MLKFLGNQTNAVSIYKTVIVYTLLNIKKPELDRLSFLLEFI